MTIRRPPGPKTPPKLRASVSPPSRDCCRKENHHGDTEARSKNLLNFSVSQCLGGDLFRVSQQALTGGVPKSGRQSRQDWISHARAVTWSTARKGGDNGAVKPQGPPSAIARIDYFTRRSTQTSR